MLLCIEFDIKLNLLKFVYRVFFVIFKKCIILDKYFNRQKILYTDV